MIRFNKIEFELDQSTETTAVVHADYTETLDLAGGGTKAVPGRRSLPVTELKAAFAEAHPGQELDLTALAGPLLPLLKGMLAGPA